MKITNKRQKVNVFCTFTIKKCRKRLSIKNKCLYLQTESMEIEKTKINF